MKAASTASKGKTGMVRTISVTIMVMPSTRPPAKPLTVPKITAMPVDTSAATKPTKITSLPPWTICEKMFAPLVVGTQPVLR